MGKYGRLAGQILRVQTRISKNFIQILPQMGRHCRDMLSDQVFLNELAEFILKSKNRNEDFLQPVFLKFLVSGKQAREIAAEAALKLLEILDSSVPEDFKKKVEEKLAISKKKLEEKKKDKKIEKDKSGKIDKKKGKKKKNSETSENLKIT